MGASSVHTKSHFESIVPLSLVFRHELCQIMSSAELHTTILKHIAQAQKLERNLALESKKRDGDIQKHIVKVGTAG
jgi:hypothetical protein